MQNILYIYICLSSLFKLKKCFFRNARHIMSYLPLHVLCQGLFACMQLIAVGTLVLLLMEVSVTGVFLPVHRQVGLG